MILSKDRLSFARLILALPAIILCMASCFGAASTAESTFQNASSNTKEKNWQNIESFICYYGNFTEDLADFDVAILEPTACTPQQVKWLNEQGVFTTGYLSVGEADTLEPDGGGPGVYASYYLSQNGMPAQNDNWQSYYVDAGNPEWQAKTLERAAEILAMGFDGLFLDTINTAERFPETFTGMCSLIEALHKAQPGAVLVGNCGAFAREEFLPYLSGVMFEDFSGTYDFTSGGYRTWADDDLAWTTEQAEQLKRLLNGKSIPVFALDYCAPNDTATQKAFAERAEKFGFLHSAANIGLDEIYT